MSMLLLHNHNKSFQKVELDEILVSFGFLGIKRCAPYDVQFLLNTDVQVELDEKRS